MIKIICEFKCRRCEKIADGSHVYLEKKPTRINDDLAAFANFDVHHCEDGGVGAADIIGYRIK